MQCIAIMENTPLISIGSSATSSAPPEQSAPAEPKSPLGNTPGRMAVMEALQITFQPDCVVVRDHTKTEGELSLGPVTDAQSTIKLVYRDGDMDVIFTVHSELLCYYSPFFNAMLDGGGVTTKARVHSKMLRREWRWEHEGDVETMEGNGYGDAEGKVQINVRVKFPGDGVRHIVLYKEEVGDVGPRAVAAFVDWLYNGFAGFTFDKFAHMKYSSTELTKLWVFAGKIGVSACQNHCIEGIELLRYQTNTINTGILGWVYENTKGMQFGEKLRTLLIDHCSWKLDGMWILAGGFGSENEVPREAVIHILGRVMVLVQSKANVMVDLPPFTRVEWRKRFYWIEDYVPPN